MADPQVTRPDTRISPTFHVDVDIESEISPRFKQLDADLFRIAQATADKVRAIAEDDTIPEGERRRLSLIEADRGFKAALSTLTKQNLEIAGAERTAHQRVNDRLAQFQTGTATDAECRRLIAERFLAGGNNVSAQMAVASSIVDQKDGAMALALINSTPIQIGLTRERHALLAQRIRFGFAKQEAEYLGKIGAATKRLEQKLAAIQSQLRLNPQQRTELKLLEERRAKRQDDAA
jgi:hypothetical protein